MKGKGNALQSRNHHARLKKMNIEEYQGAYRQMMNRMVQWLCVWVQAENGVGEHEHGQCMPVDAIRNTGAQAVLCKGMSMPARDISVSPIWIVTTGLQFIKSPIFNITAHRKPVDFMHDIRWIQRFSNFNKALAQLGKFIEKKALNELEMQGLIQSFVYTHELAWNVLKDFLESRGTTPIYGSKDATREAFKLNLIVNGDIWMDMIESRNQTSHTYNQETTNEIAEAILSKYYQEFLTIQKTLRLLEEKDTK